MNMSAPRDDLLLELQSLFKKISHLVSPSASRPQNGQGRPLGIQDQFLGTCRGSASSTRPRLCWRPHGCSTTWGISSVTTPPLRQWLVVSTLTASGYRSFSASALPSATSRTIMRLNSNRDIRCSSIDSLNTKAQFSTRPNWTFCAIVQQILLPLQVLEPRSELIISKLIKSALLTIIASGLRMEQSPSAAWTAIM